MFAYLTRRSRRVGLDLVQGHQGRFEPLWEYYLEDLEEYRISLFSFQNLIAHEGQGSIGGREGVGPWWADELLLIKVLRSKDRLISENWRFNCMKSTNFGSCRIELLDGDCFVIVRLFLFFSNWCCFFFPSLLKSYFLAGRSCGFVGDKFVCFIWREFVSQRKSQKLWMEV